MFSTAAWFHQNADTLALRFKQECTTKKKVKISVIVFHLYLLFTFEPRSS
jgi:hypothetical protein